MCVAVMRQRSEAFESSTMRPVAVFRFSPGDEPGRFAQWLDANRRPWPNQF
jgi:hypothetical protein